MGQNSQTTTQNQTASSNPYAPAIAGINNIIQQIGAGGTPLTPAQTMGLSTLTAGAGGIPTNLGSNVDAMAGIVAQLGGANGPLAQLGGSNGLLQKYLAPYMSSDFTNPMTTPGFSTALNTLNTDITNNINSQFSAGGRAVSPDAAMALARGLSQGEGGLIASEANTLSSEQLAAINALTSGTIGTSTAETAANQAAAGLYGSVPGLYTAPGAATLQAANIGQQLPFQNLLTPEQMLMNPGQAFASNTSNGTSQTVQPVNPFTTGIGAGLGLLALMPSDERLKEDIEPVGLLKNGLPIYKYRFIGSPKMQIGVMAQDVEQVMPDAVHESADWGLPGPSFKMVDYDRATGPISYTQ